MMKGIRSLNLNTSAIPSDKYLGAKVPLEDVSYQHERVACYFRNVKQHLIRHIKRADYVFGCVAWLTDPDILDALAQKRGVSLLCQKEDFLRPDIHSKPGWNQELRAAYDRLTGVQRHWFHGQGIASSLSCASDPKVDPVRCVGVRGGGSGSNHPRMHHKFALFCKEASTENEVEMWERPYEVWTGSFNWSKNASNSLENAVVISEACDPKTVKGFYMEYQQILGLSEPLDWTSNWVAPQWRIGS